MGAARRATALVLLLALTGCADAPSARPAATAAPVSEPSAATAPPVDQPDPPPSTAPEPSPEPGPVEQRCDHPTEGYSVPFPADWHVASADGIEPCTFFDPRPLQLEPNSEATGVAVRAEVRDAPFLQARQDVMAEGGQVLEETVVTERAAARISGALTEEVLLPAGTRFTTWLVELDAGTLLLTTDDAGADDYDSAVTVLDAMAEGLEIP